MMAEIHLGLEKRKISQYDMREYVSEHFQNILFQIEHVL